MTCERTSALLAWLASNCDSEKLARIWTEDAHIAMQQDPASPSGDRVLAAVAPLRRGFRMPIPPPCVLSEDKVSASPIGAALSGMDKFTQFAFFLVLERRRGSASFWKPYLDMLPTDIAFHPITFAERQQSEPLLAAAVAAEPLLARALAAQTEKLRNEFETACKLIAIHARDPQPSLARNALREAFTSHTASSSSSAKKANSGSTAASAPRMDEFIWATCMVLSRAFNLEEPEKLMCMLPLADSMNHVASGATVQWRPRLARGFFMLTLAVDIPAGAQLTGNYHHGSAEERSELDRLRNYLMYGFVEHDDFHAVREAAAAQPFAPLAT